MTPTTCSPFEPPRITRLTFHPPMTDSDSRSNSPWHVASRRSTRRRRPRPDPLADDLRLGPRDGRSAQEGAPPRKRVSHTPASRVVGSLGYVGDSARQGRFLSRARPSAAATPPARTDKPPPVFLHFGGWLLTDPADASCPRPGPALPPFLDGAALVGWRAPLL